MVATIEALEKELTQLMGYPVSLKPPKENEERLCIILLERLKAALMDSCVDEDCLKADWEWSKQPIPDEGLHNHFINLACSIIARLNMMGRQEEVGMMLGEWRKDAFFRAK